MSRVVHFEINADQPERAIKFYADVFDWQIQKWDGPQDYWLVSTGDRAEPGIDGAIQNRQAPGMTTVLTVDVESVDEVTAKVASGGGKVLEAKIPVPGVGYFALCQDSEGNHFGLMQADTSLK